MFEAVSATGLIAEHGEEWDGASRDDLGNEPPRLVRGRALTVSAGSNSPAAVYDTEHPFIGLYTLATGVTRVGKLIDDQSVSRRLAIEPTRATALTP